MSDIITLKNNLRKEYLAIRANISNRLKSEEEIRKKLFDFIDKNFGLVKNLNIFSYVSIGCEVDTTAILSYYIIRAKNLIVPYTDSGFNIIPKAVSDVKNLKADKLGNLDFLCGEKEFKEHIDLAVIPLLAFDDNNFRLGYGKGCFDKFLSGNNIFKIGLAFSEQYYSRRLDFENDIPLDVIITPDKIHIQQ